MLQNITHALSPTHTDAASAMVEIFTGSQRRVALPYQMSESTLPNAAVQAIELEIKRKQAEIEALKTALATLTGSSDTSQAKSRGARRAKTAAEKQAMSRAMKAAWRRRKAAAKQGKRSA
jgi:hypothetical protein